MDLYHENATTRRNNECKQRVVHRYSSDQFEKML